MAWLFLILGGLCEIGWPLGFKLSSVTQYKWIFIVIAILSMTLSGLLLYLAQKEIPIGTAYAVWTGIGAAGTFFVGIIFFGDSASFMRLFSAFLLIAGIVGLKIF